MTSTWGFEGVKPDESVRKKGRTASIYATQPSGDMYGHLSGELLDPLLLQEGRERERASELAKVWCT